MSDMEPEELLRAMYTTHGDQVQDGKNLGKAILITPNGDDVESALRRNKVKTKNPFKQVFLDIMKSSLEESFQPKSGQIEEEKS